MGLKARAGAIVDRRSNGKTDRTDGPTENRTRVSHLARMFDNERQRDKMLRHPSRRQKLT